MIIEVFSGHHRQQCKIDSFIQEELIVEIIGTQVQCEEYVILNSFTKNFENPPSTSRDIEEQQKQNSVLMTGLCSHKAIVVNFSLKYIPC